MQEIIFGKVIKKKKLKKLISLLLLIFCFADEKFLVTIELVNSDGKKEIFEKSFSSEEEEQFNKFKIGDSVKITINEFIELGKAFSTK
ncbi:MAG: hypothetical protein RI945_264 [Candidatus Parcubacteria bacterium]|jgi:hypothetical protein